jgi:hypothetical protein
MRAIDDYTSRQADLDAEYRRAWADAPESFKRAAAELGLKPDTSREAHACEYDEGNAASSYTPEMDIDSELDVMIEELGKEHETAIRAVVGKLEEKKRLEVQREASSTVTRIVCYMIKTDKGNIQARIHQLLHTIPGLAEVVGFKSMRESARSCGVSVEWLRRGREEWCKVLDIPMPAASSKSEEAKAKYAENGRRNHWRQQKYKANPAS